MEIVKGSNEQIVASEAFTPVLSGEYIERYSTLLEKLSSVLPANRVGVIRKEISLVSEEDETLDLLKYLASLSVLIDLSQQGWVFDIEDKKLVLRMEIDNIDDKKMLRYRLSAERNAQFKTDSVADFIRRMEADKKVNNETLSIKVLFGNPQLLLDRINNNEKVCEPSYDFSVTTISSHWMVKKRVSAEANIGDFIFEILSKQIDGRRSPAIDLIRTALSNDTDDMTKLVKPIISFPSESEKRDVTEVEYPDDTGIKWDSCKDSIRQGFDRLYDQSPGIQGTVRVLVLQPHYL